MIRDIKKYLNLNDNKSIICSNSWQCCRRNFVALNRSIGKLGGLKINKFSSGWSDRSNPKKQEGTNLRTDMSEIKGKMRSTQLKVGPLKMFQYIEREKCNKIQNKREK